LLVLE